MTDKRSSDAWAPEPNKIEAWPSDDSGRAIGSDAVVVPVGGPDVKTCPACAEEVKAAARVCRFCGYDFDPAFVKAHPDQVPTSVTNAPRWTALRWTTLRFLLPIGLIFVLLFGLAFFLSNQLKQNLPPKKTPKPSATASVPAGARSPQLAYVTRISVAGLVLTFPEL